MTATPFPEELVERLDKLANSIDADRYEECCEIMETPTGKDLRAAAALIRELVERQAAIINGASILEEQRCKRIVELEAALRPFAEYARDQFANHLPPNIAADDNTPVSGGLEDSVWLYVGDLRRAAKALEAK